MTGIAERPRRPGRPPRLSRDAVVEAAERIIERYGIEALTMRRVAEALDSSPMALYRHVRNKDDLLLLLLDRLVARLERPKLSDDPRERLLDLLRWQHDEFAARPWVVYVLVTGDIMAPSILWFMEEVYATFQACGLTLEQAAQANRIIWQFMSGELVQQNERVRRSGARDRTPYQVSLLARADPAEYPTLASMFGYWTSERRWNSFHTDLELLVDALLARVT